MPIDTAVYGYFGSGICVKFQGGNPFQTIQSIKDEGARQSEVAKVHEN